MTHLSVHLLGPFQANLDDRSVIGFDSDKVRALLAYLMVENDRPHRREMLAGLLWPDYTESSARTNLRSALSNLRRVIHDRYAPTPFLIVTRQSIQFNSGSDFWLDVNQLVASLGAKAGVRRDIQLLESGVELYSGHFLEGFSIPDSSSFEGWSLQIREWLQRQVIDALMHLSRFHGEAGNYPQALKYSQRQVELEPFDEEAHIQLIRVLALQGHRVEALSHCKRFLKTLEEDLGIEPTNEFISLCDQIQSGEFVAPIPSAIITPVIPPKPPNFLEEFNERRSAHEFIFVARQRELAFLDDILDQTLRGRGTMAFVTGGAGRGKSALLRQFVQNSLEANPDLLAVAGNCSALAGRGDPFLPFRDIIHLLCGDLETHWTAGTITRIQALHIWDSLSQTLQALIDHGPQLIDLFFAGGRLKFWTSAPIPGQPDASVSVEKDWQRQRGSLNEYVKMGEQATAQHQIFQQYGDFLQALASLKPLLIVLDDLQWADNASISLLFHLGRSIEGSRVMVACAYRPDELSQGRDGERHPLENVLSEFRRRFGNVWLDLAERKEGEDRVFVDAFLDRSHYRFGERFRQSLVQRTEGHPLFTIELLQSMEESGNLIRNEEGWWTETSAPDWDALPARIEGVIAERLDRLNPELRDVLNVASVEGEVFIAQIAARVLGSPERKILHQLSQVLEKRYRLVRQRGEITLGDRCLSRYAFAHSMFSHYLYDDLGPGEQRLLHGEIAEALEDLYSGFTDQVAFQLAHHYSKAKDVDKAVSYLNMAGDQARRLYAHQEAAEYYQRALALLKQQTDHEQTARTLMKLGLTHHCSFDYEAARQAYQEGFLYWKRLAWAKHSAADFPSSAPHPLRVTAFEPVTLGLGLEMDFPSHVVLDQLYSGLVEVGPDMGLVPDVARSWEVLEGGRKYIFQLRDDVFWSDGHPVTAHDFEFAWKLILDPASDQRWHVYLEDIKNSRAYHRRELVDSSLVGVTATDIFTLEVELDGPTGYFPYLLAFLAGYPMPQHIVERHGSAWVDVDNIVTNGPFQLISWERGESLVLERNPKYHGRFTGNLQRVECTFLIDIPERYLRSYEEDELDICGGLALAEFSAARNRFTEEYLSGPWMSTSFIGFDVSKPPFRDVRVRQALALSTEREKIADVILQGYSFPATGGIIPPGMPGHSPEIGLPYDPEEAKKLLSDAGCPGGIGFPVVVGFSRDDPGHELVCNYLEAQWQDHLGLKIDWRQIEWGSFYDSMSERAPDIWMVSWYADYPDPDNFLRICWWLSFGGWQNQTFRDLVEEARRVVNQPERMKLYQEADKILIEEAAVLPLCYGRFHMLVKPWVKKLFSSPLKWWSWKDVIIEDH